jgi:hypothetical protein
MGTEDDGRITRRDVLTKLSGGLAGLSISTAFPNTSSAQADVTQASLRHSVVLRANCSRLLARFWFLAPQKLVSCNTWMIN